MLITKLSRYRKFLLLFALALTILILCLKKLSRVTENVNVVRNIDRKVEGSHKLAILVPFRDRFDELVFFVPNLSKFLNEQGIKLFNIYILNQTRRYRFNRGALTNAGFLLTRNESDYIAIHDVDLLPMNRNLSYEYPEKGPYHLASPEYHPNYNYAKYFGGILLINNQHFELVNGMSNRYFGWGLEDDEFYTRIKAAKLPITRPENLTTHKENTFLHYHYQRSRDTFKTKQQRDELKRRDLMTGLKDSRFSVSSKHDIVIDGYACTLYNIEIFCDTKKTPWCLQTNKKKITDKPD